MSKHREIDKGLKGLGSQLFGAVRKEVKLRISVRCNDCGGIKSSFMDSSPCPHPDVLPDSGDQVQDVTITLKSTDPQPSEPGVTRFTAKDSDRKPPERISAPVKDVKPEPEKRQTRFYDDDPEFNPNATPYRRGATSGTGWDMSSEDLAAAIDKANSPADIDD